MEEKLVQTLVRLLEKNGLDNGIRFAIQGHKTVHSAKMIGSVIEFMEELGVTTQVLKALQEKAATRTPLPFKLHYTDGYVSWFYEKSKKIDGFFYDDYLISINHTSAVGNYDEAVARCAGVKLDGKSCQPLPAEVCLKLYEDCLKSVNLFLHSHDGSGFWGIVWTQTPGHAFNFDTGKFVDFDGRRCEFHARPAIKL